MNNTTAIELIAQERKEQIEKHGKTVESDATINKSYDLKDGAIGILTDFKKWPKHWNADQGKRIWSKPYKKRLIIAAALLAAEIDRLIFNEEQQKKA